MSNEYSNMITEFLEEGLKTEKVHDEKMDEIYYTSIFGILISFGLTYAFAIICTLVQAPTGVYIIGCCIGFGLILAITIVNAICCLRRVYKITYPVYLVKLATKGSDRIRATMDDYIVVEWVGESTCWVRKKAYRSFKQVGEKNNV